MAILKWRDGNGKWISLYANWLRQCLRRDKNLSDLDNAEEARKNLGVSAENITTVVDNKYQPIVEDLETKINNVTKEVSGKYYIGDASPEPKDGTIWFDTKSSLIKFYKDSTWHTFGSAGLDMSTL